MKLVEIFTDGTLHFTKKHTQSIKQIIFYEKDSRTSLFSKKVRKKQLFQNLHQNVYKSKYKF